MEIGWKEGHSSSVVHGRRTLMKILREYCRSYEWHHILPSSIVRYILKSVPEPRNFQALESKPSPNLPVFFD
jgi:hypothetical protein